MCDLTPCPRAFQFVHIDVLVERGVTWTTERELKRRIKVGGGGHFLPLPPIVAGRWKCCGEMLLLPQIPSERVSYLWGNASSHVEAGLKAASSLAAASHQKCFPAFHGKPLLTLMGNSEKTVSWRFDIP